VNAALKAASWDESCFVRERMEAMVAALLLIFVEPCWYLFDRAVEPDLALTFLPWRLGTAAVSIVFVVLLAQARNCFQVRLLNFVNVSQTCLVVAGLTTFASNSAEYLISFSVVLWATGATFTWPARWELALCSFSLTTILTPFILIRSPSVGSTATYLVTTAIVCVVGVGVRRSLHRRAYEASHDLAEANSELEQTVLELREAQARTVAAEKQAALGRLLAGLSHEINNPLTIVQNTIDPLDNYFNAVLHVLDRAQETTSSPERVAADAVAVELAFMRTDHAEAIDAMRVACQRIRSIQHDLRNFVRGDTKGMEVGDLSPGLQSTIQLFRQGLPPGVQVEGACPPLPPVAHSPGPLNQVFASLLQNALDAVGDTGTISIVSRIASDGIEISVSDTGPGVPTALQNQIFEPFFSTKGTAAGSGLGLAISQQIVQQHGGTLELDRNYSLGARFVMWIPTHTQGQQPDRAVHSSPNELRPI
jgi:signal transduction histidine kinase